MGLFTDLAANALTIDFGGDDGFRHGTQRADVHGLRGIEARLGDIDYPSGFEAVDEYQEIPEVEADDGTYTLTFDIYNGESFTTAAIDHDDDAAAIQAIVDTAADGVVTGYTAGDIEIAGGPIDTAALEITFSGASVAGKPHGDTVVNSSLLANGVTITVTETTAGDTGVDEVQTITADTDLVSGTYQLDFSLAGAETFSTGNIDFDDDAAAIQTAVDAGADGNVAGYTPGDIAVTGGPLNEANIVLTFSGASVDEEDHDLTVVDGASLVASSEDPAVDSEETVEGQTVRTPWAILKVLGVITGAPPAQGTSDAVTRDTTPVSNPHYPDQGLIRALAREAAAQDRNADVETAILTAVGL